MSDHLPHLSRLQPIAFQHWLQAKGTILWLSWWSAYFSTSIIYTHQPLLKFWEWKRNHIPSLAISTCIRFAKLSENILTTGTLHPWVWPWQRWTLLQRHKFFVLVMGAHPKWPEMVATNVLNVIYKDDEVWTNISSCCWLQWLQPGCLYTPFFSILYVISNSKLHNIVTELSKNFKISSIFLVKFS